MELANLGIALRPRRPWEAIDLGFTLARQWFLPLCRLWLMTAVPIALLSLLFLHGHLVLLSLLIWWCKPLYEPALMFWLGRAVFGEKLSARAVMRQWWRIVRPHLFANLTWARLSPNRSFYMPVALLEGLKGKERRQRIAVLGRRQQAGTWLTIVGIHFEGVLEFGFLSTIYFLVPEELRWFDGSDFFFSPGLIDEWIQVFCWSLAMLLIAPFYVAAGFALYLHRRSELEGWDIEINFRRTVERMKPSRQSVAGAVAAVLLTVLLVTLTPGRTMAAEPTEATESKQAIEQVLADPLFGRMEEQSRWKYVGKKKEDTTNSSNWFIQLMKFLLKILKGFFSGFANIGEVLMWLAGLSIVAYLIYHFSRNSQWMQFSASSGRDKKRELPATLFGLNVRADSLPDDIGQAVLSKLADGDLRGALSLLYRGSLVRLVVEHQLDIPSSATEGEALTIVRQQRNQQEADFFRKLTHAWLRTAYGHFMPERAEIEQLCQDWEQVYG